MWNHNKSVTKFSKEDIFQPKPKDDDLFHKGHLLREKNIV